MPSPSGWLIFLGPVAVMVVQVLAPAVVQSFIRHLRYVGILPRPTEDQPAKQKERVKEQVKYWNICVAVSSFFSSSVSLCVVSSVYAVLVPGMGRLIAVIVLAGCLVLIIAVFGIRRSTAKKWINKDHFEEELVPEFRLAWESRWTKLRFAVVVVSWVLALCAFLSYISE